MRYYKKGNIIVVKEIIIMRNEEFLKNFAFHSFKLLHPHGKTLL